MVLNNIAKQINMLYEIEKAICLLMVIEGILPFISPSIWKKMMETILKKDDQFIRLNAFLIMLIGVISLHVIRN